ncbi:MAG: hypothetical protein QXM05_07210, partial [Zestosphaera sp.]
RAKQVRNAPQLRASFSRTRVEEMFPELMYLYVLGFLAFLGDYTGVWVSRCLISTLGFIDLGAPFIGARVIGLHSLQGSSDP